MELREQGIARFVGVSNFDAGQLARIEPIGHVDTMQPPLSLINRKALDGTLQWCAEHGTGVIAYSRAVSPAPGRPLSRRPEAAPQGRRQASIRSPRLIHARHCRRAARFSSRGARDVRDEDADDFKAFEARAWDDRAATYDLVTGAVTEQVAGPLLDLAAVGEGTRVLDVGCGLGAVAAAAAARGARPVGLDLADGMLALARERHPGLELVAGDAEALPFADRTFGAVVAGFLVNHVPDPGRLLAECARVLEPGGRVALALWDRAERNPLLGELSAAVGDAGIDVRAGLPAGPDPYRLADEEEMRRALEAAGLAAVHGHTLELVHRASGAGELWRGLMGGSVRISTVVARQPAGVRAAIRRAFDRRIARYADHGGGLALPARVRLAAAARPARSLTDGPQGDRSGSG